jgi:hypothetical protein
MKRFLLGLAAACTTTAGTEPSPPPPDDAAGTWDFFAGVLVYFPEEERDFASPTFMANRGRLHLEGRYNYEGLDTGSLWAGYNLHWAGALDVTLTPMIGGVFGDTRGFAPGYRIEAAWWRLNLSGEGEYVLDADSRDDNFLFLWTELSVAPLPWLRAGFVAQRTRLYEGEVEVERGLLAGVAWRDFTFTTYVFNPDADRPLVVLSLGVAF